VFVGHSRTRTDHACRILGLNACAAGLSGELHCRLVEGDGKQALLCKLAIRGNEGGSRRVKHVQRARMKDHSASMSRFDKLVVVKRDGRVQTSTVRVKNIYERERE